MEYEHLDHLINTNALDIRAEIIIAALLEQGTIEPDQILIRPRGLFKRPFSKDILAVETNKSGQQKKQVLIDVSREGLYDMLPEGLFHQAKNQKSYINTEASVAETRRFKKEEEEARKFFLPLEQEYYRLRVSLEVMERRVWEASSISDNEDLLLKFWAVSRKDLAPYQATALLSLLPYAAQIVGNLSLIRLYLQMFLGEEVTLHEMSPHEMAPHEIAPAEYTREGSKLGETRLGTACILGGQWHSEVHALKISIGPIEAEHLSLYLSDNKVQNVLHTLYHFLLPADTEVMHEVMVKEDQQHFALSEEPFAARLSYTTMI